MPRVCTVTGYLANGRVRETDDRRCFSSKGLTPVRELLARQVDSGDVPGAVAVVARHGVAGPPRLHVLDFLTAAYRAIDD